MDCNNNGKTWNLAQRTRQISRGQAKIFLAKNSANQQRLAKLSQHLDKEKSAKRAEVTFAQKLLLKRHGGAQRDVEGDHPRPSRDRSYTWDSTFVTKLPEEYTTCADISRVHSLGNLSAEKQIPNRKDSHGNGVRMYQSHTISISDGELDRDLANHTARSPQPKPDAVCDILPPIRLPPLYTADNHRSSGKTTKSNAHQKKISSNAEPQGRKMIPAIGHEKLMDGDLSNCRYLRKIEKE